MPFDYYERLSRTQKATYRRSDAVGEVPVPAPALLAPALDAIRSALEADDRSAVARAVQQLVQSLLVQLGAPPVRCQVLARRPSDDTAELHGLYTREEGKVPLLQVWMRTAANQKPVAFRTFVRTLLHEVGHHLDFELLHLEDTFHTQGFFRRESSLARQLLAEVAEEAEPKHESAAKKGKRAARSDAQLDLFAPPKKSR